MRKSLNCIQNLLSITHTYTHPECEFFTLGSYLLIHISSSYYIKML